METALMERPGIESDRKRVYLLILDDDQQFTLVLSRVLVEAVSPTEHVIRKAISSFDGDQTVNDPVDVALVDNELPDGSGSEFIANIHQLLPTLRIATVAHASDPIARTRVLDAGARATLDKSAPSEALLRTLSRLIDQLPLVAA